MDFSLEGSAPQSLAEHPPQLAAGGIVPEFRQDHDDPAEGEMVVSLDTAEL